MSEPTEVTLSFARLENLTNENETLRNAEGFSSLISDILQVDGLDGVLHVLELNFDPELGSGFELLWFDAGLNGAEDDA